MAKTVQRLAILVVVTFFALAVCQMAIGEDDVIHAFTGVVKHVDKGTKTMVVKTADGTEHTVKWTGKTSWEGTKESGKGLKEGSQVTVKYTEKAGEKTAVGVKDASKDTAKAMNN